MPLRAHYLVRVMLSKSAETDRLLAELVAECVRDSVANDGKGRFTTTKEEHEKAARARYEAMHIRPTAHMWCVLSADEKEDKTAVDDLEIVMPLPKGVKSTHGGDFAPHWPRPEEEVQRIVAAVKRVAPDYKFVHGTFQPDYWMHEMAYETDRKAMVARQQAYDGYGLHDQPGRDPYHDHHDRGRRGRDRDRDYDDDFDRERHMELLRRRRAHQPYNRGSNPFDGRHPPWSPHGFPRSHSQSRSTSDNFLQADDVPARHPRDELLEISRRIARRSEQPNPAPQNSTHPSQQPQNTTDDALPA